LATTEANRVAAEKSFQRKVNYRESILEQMIAIHDSERIGKFRGTVWGALNSATEYADWSKPQRERGTQEERNERRFMSILNGDRDSVKQIALSQANALIV
jgi:hypothetical protein